MVSLVLEGCIQNLDRVPIFHEVELLEDAIQASTQPRQHDLQRR